MMEGVLYVGSQMVEGVLYMGTQKMDGVPYVGTHVVEGVLYVGPQSIVFFLLNVNLLLKQMFSKADSGGLKLS